MLIKIWDEIIYAFINFNDYTVEVWERMSFYTTLYISMLRLKSNMLVKGAPSLKLTNWRELMLTIETEMIVVTSRQAWAPFQYEDSLLCMGFPFYN